MMTPKRIETRPAREDQYDGRGRKVRGGVPTGNPEHRAVCSCDYATSWVADKSVAVALHDLHRVVHGRPPA